MLDEIQKSIHYGKMTIGIREGREITWKELKDELALFHYTEYSLLQYTDFRCSTDLNARFLYDPFTGETIPWKELRKECKIKVNKND